MLRLIDDISYELFTLSQAEQVYVQLWELTTMYEQSWNKAPRSQMTWDPSAGEREAWAEGGGKEGEMRDAV